MVRTSIILLNKINQHRPKSLLNKIRIGNNRNIGRIQDKIFSNSVIGEHLVDNPNCFEKCDLNKFKTISKARSEFQLKALEAIYILCKNLDLCKKTNLFIRPYHNGLASGH